MVAWTRKRSPAANAGSRNLPAQSARTASGGLRIRHDDDPEGIGRTCGVDVRDVGGEAEKVACHEDDRLPNDEIERARRVVPIAAVQNHYNLSERKHEEVVDYCESENIVFVPFFPLRGDGGRTVEEIAARHGATPVQITLAWLLRRSPAMLPIPGTLSLEHLKENVAALQIELTDVEFEALR
jgi:hypothetical protein